MDTISTENLSKTINDASNFAILTHKRPDGDAISSSLAIFWYLVDIGKREGDIDIIIPEFLSDFSFVPGIEYLRKSPTKEEYDAIIVVDCAETHLLEGVDILKRTNKVICFDHHEETTLPFDIGIIDSSAPSCTSIIYKLLKCDNLWFKNCIATGLISDTGSMTMDLARRFDIINNLLYDGVNVEYIVSKLSSPSDRTIQLVELIVKRGKFENSAKGNIFYSYILQSDLLESEKNLNAVNHKSIIAEVANRISYDHLILLIENKEKEFKASIRTNSQIDLSSICASLISKGKALRGGGHKNSAGCTSSGNYEDIFSNIISEIINY